MSFLTVEDVNTVNLNHINEYYELDTSKISEQEFDYVLHDFCIVSHSINGAMHTFSFEIHNELWTGGYYFTTPDGNYLDINASRLNDGTIVFNTEDYDSVILHLYLCSFAPSFNFKRLEGIFIDAENNGIYTLPNNKIRVDKNLTIKTLKTNKIQTINFSPNSFGIYNAAQFYLLFLLIKTDVLFGIEHECTVGIINKIRLNVDRDFLPEGSLVSDEMLDINIRYEDKLITTYFDDDLGDYCFDLDLTNKRDNKPVKLEIMVNEINLVNAAVHNVVLDCKYSSASSYEELQRTIISGAEIIELTGDITLNNNLSIPRNLLIYGNNHNIYLSSYNIQIHYNISAEIDDINFFNGTNCFIQQLNSKLVLKNCRFNNAVISDNYKGSVISADYDGTDDSIITELIGCTFLNCHHTIYHGGELTINNCKALFNTINEGLDTDYPAFLTSYDGSVEVTNSIFDIDYNIEELCSNDVDIKFAEALIGLGENTIFNGYSTNQLKYNDILPFFEAPYNHKSHIFVKYYYPQIDACVISSPVIGKEDNCVCHMILGIDWVYKNNVLVSRADWNSENTIRKINWEDI